MFRFALTLGMLCAVVLTGCAAPVKVVTLGSDTPEPVAVESERVHAVEFERIRSDIDEGEEIGKYYGGLLKIVQVTYVAQAVLSVEFQEISCQVVTDELREAGYATSKCESETVFESLQADARFAVAGTYLEASINRYDSLAGNKSEATCRIRWQLLDRSLNDVVYSEEWFGSAVGPGPDSRVSSAAQRSSFRCVLADPAFVTAVRRRESS